MKKYPLTTHIKILDLLAQINLTPSKNAIGNYMTSLRTNKISLEEAKNLIEKIKNDLRKIVKKHSEKGSCSNLNRNFYFEKKNSFFIPHFYIIWKILKIPP